MGIKQIIADDLTGKELPSDTTPTQVRMNGDDYTLYLSPESLETFTALLNGEAPLLADARPARSSRSRSTKPNVDKEYNTKVRAWAQSTGFKYKGADGKDRVLGDRGAIPQVVLDAYEAAN